MSAARRDVTGKTVVHVSSAHRVSDGRISKKEALSLASHGYKVTVLALERANGFRPSADLEYIEYDKPCSRLRRFILRLPWLIWFCTRNHYDVYHLHDPELILLGLVLRALGRRVVYDAHEAYPMVILDRDWIPRLLRPVLSSTWRRFEAFLVRKATLTIVAHESLKEQFDGGRISVIHNYPIMSDYSLSEVAEMSGRPARLIYHGDLTQQRGLFSMVEAMGKLDDSINASLRLAGSLTTSAAERMEHLDGFDRCRYLGWLDGSALAQELGSARAGLVLLHPTNNYLKIRPNKLYEYMAAGLPVVASNFPFWREIVEHHRVGILVDPLDVQAIADAIAFILANPEEATAMGRRGRKAVAEHFNWQQEEKNLIHAYEGMWT